MSNGSAPAGSSAPRGMNRNFALGSISRRMSHAHPIRSTPMFSQVPHRIASPLSRIEELRADRPAELRREVVSGLRLLELFRQRREVAAFLAERREDRPVLRSHRLLELPGQ